MRPRLQSNGDLVFPARGTPPKEQEGYTKDKNDQYRLLSVWPDCKHRTFRTIKSGCCGSYTVTVCGKNNKPITIHICRKCNDKD
jgi:hypothetical protein